jgi:DNA-binding NarL/FixJ family response regulator
VRIRVFVADDQPIVLCGLRSLFHKAPEIRLVGEAHDTRQVVEDASRLHPDLLLLDIGMQELRGLEILSELRRRRPEMRIVVYSKLCSPEYVQKAFQLGVVGFITKTQQLSDFVSILRAVHQGGTYLSPTLGGAVAGATVHPLNHSATGRLLTAREARVLELIVQEQSSKEIAEVLKITARTVDVHRANIMKKLDIHTIAGLVRYALQLASTRA